MPIPLIVGPVSFIKGLVFVNLVSFAMFHIILEPEFSGKVKSGSDQFSAYAFSFIHSSAKFSFLYAFYHPVYFSLMDFPKTAARYPFL